MDRDHQTEGELEAHYGVAGPVAAAQEWIRLILEEKDLLRAWKLTDPDLRLAMTQAWTWANRSHPLLADYDLEVLAQDLATETDSHPLWEDFENVQLSEFETAWENVDLDNWGVASRPRPTVPDYELILFVETGGEIVVFTEETEVFAIGVLVHLTPEGFRVADAGDPRPDRGPRKPSWPPAV
jgi:hypothetical protein